MTEGKYPRVEFSVCVCGGGGGGRVGSLDPYVLEYFVRSIVLVGIRLIMFSISFNVNIIFPI